MNIDNLYDARVKDLLLTTNHKIPSCVPVVSNLVTWQVGYKGRKLNDLYANPDLYIDTMSSVYEDVYADCYFAIGVSVNIPAYRLLGCNTFFISPDGVTLQHKQDCKMTEDDYPMLIKDPRNFMINILAPRRYPALNDSRENVKKLLIQVMKEISRFSKMNKDLNNTCKTKYGIAPLRSGSKMMSPFDIIFDRLRGFRDTMVDVRRHPHELMAAVNALAPNYYNPLEKINSPYPYVGATPHAPTYLGGKNFEKFYWPSYSRMIEKIAEKGSKAMINFEGSWKAYYNSLMEMPRSSIIGIVEDDDPAEAKKIIGNKVTLIAGVQAQILKYKSKAECFDLAKKIIDEMSPGGGFMFSTDKNLLSLNDVNPETYIELQEFVHNYKAY